MSFENFPDSLLLGYHYKFDINKFPANINVIAGFKCIQIFVEGPYNSVDFIKSDDIKKLKKLSEKIKIYVHASYLDHLLPRTIHFAYRNIHKQLEICDQFNASGFVAHIPAISPDQFAEVMAKIAQRTFSTQIYMEINTYKGPEFNYAKLENLMSIIPILRKNNVGLLIDTAHLWASGVDIRSYANMNSYLQAIPEDIPLAFHLNDQKYEFESGRDEHRPIGEGTIWSGSLKSRESSGWMCVVEYALKHECPVILEYNVTI